MFEAGKGGSGERGRRVGAEERPEGPDDQERRESSGDEKKPVGNKRRCFAPTTVLSHWKVLELG